MLNIGETADTGGGQATGTVSAKENAILGILKNGGMPVVKSIQRGTVTVPKNGGEATVQISPVDISKSILLIAGAGGEHFSNSAWANHVVGYISTSTQVIFRKGSTRMMGSLDSDTPTGYWQVVEFY